MHEAARLSTCPDIVRDLIENGALVSSVDRYGYTPLHLAARENTKSYMLRVLLEHDASRTAVDNRGKRPIDLVDYINIDCKEEKRHLLTSWVPSSRMEQSSEDDSEDEIDC